MEISPGPVKHRIPARPGYWERRSSGVSRRDSCIILRRRRSLFRRST